MIALDTNVLLRYLTHDDQVQFQKAAKTIEPAIAQGDGCFVSSIILCELVWVLDACLSLAKAGIADVVEQLLVTRGMVMEHAECARKALERYRRGRADFSDYLIGEIARDGHADTTVTFDRQLAREDGFTVL